MPAWVSFLFFFAIRNLLGAPLDYFQADYTDSRQSFRQSCSRAQGVEAAWVSQKEDLSIDTAWFPPTRAKKNLFILVSGIHGVEGPAGAGIQRMFVDRVLPGLDRKNLGIFLIHAANPYGFKHSRRVNAANVDLNRNFATANELFEEVNEGYRKVQSLFNPDFPARAGGLGEWAFGFKAVYYLVRYSMSSMRQAALQGQYHYPQGIYFGGKSFQRETLALQAMIDEKSKGYERIYFVSLHTGYGKNRQLHFLPTYVKSAKSEEVTRFIFDGLQVEPHDSTHSYETHGDLVDYVVKRFGQSKVVVAVDFEYGTMDSQTTLGSIRSIRNLVLENQGFHHGYATPRDELEIKTAFRQMFFPSSVDWRNKAIAQGEMALRVTVNRFIRLP